MRFGKRAKKIENEPSITKILNPEELKQMIDRKNSMIKMLKKKLYQFDNGKGNFNFSSLEKEIIEKEEISESCESCSLKESLID